jgi:BirA family transcriptional regulator, biotin operon repressor / biotin---[acetyl-CoA-carboxylase] ligase
MIECAMSCSRHAESFDWPFVKTLITYDVVDSTSTRAAELVRIGHHELPLAVWARTQTDGRGRGHNQWWSDAGSLTVTLAINPREHGLSIENEPKLALATAVAVIEALHELKLGSPALGIRWPNDIEVDGRKLGGILPERLETSRGHMVLIGIGLNVLTDLTAAPARVRAMATSLATLHASPLDQSVFTRLFSAILGQIASVLPRLAVADPALARQWDELDLLRSQWAHVDLGTHRVAGWGRGIDQDGALCLHDGHHPLRIFGGQVLRDPP